MTRVIDQKYMYFCENFIIIGILLIPILLYHFILNASNFFLPKQTTTKKNIKVSTLAVEFQKIPLFKKKWPLCRQIIIFTSSLSVLNVSIIFAYISYNHVI